MVSLCYALQRQVSRVTLKPEPAVSEVLCETSSKKKTKQKMARQRRAASPM